METVCEHKYDIGNIVYFVGGMWFWTQAFPALIKKIEFTTGYEPVYHVELLEMTDKVVWRRAEHELYPTQEKAEASFQ